MPLKDIVQAALPLIDSKYGPESLEKRAFEWQLECLETKVGSQGIRYNDTLIEFGLRCLAEMKPRMYDCISKILHLPSRAMLYKVKGNITGDVSTDGPNVAIIKAMREVAIEKNWWEDEQSREVVLSFDSMSIRNQAVLHRGTLVGFVSQWLRQNLSQ